jgi:hypothetical protein
MPCISSPCHIASVPEVFALAMLSIVVYDRTSWARRFRHRHRHRRIVVYRSLTRIAVVVAPTKIQARGKPLTILTDFALSLVWAKGWRCCWIECGRWADIASVVWASAMLVSRCLRHSLATAKEAGLR